MVKNFIASSFFILLLLSACQTETSGPVPDNPLFVQLDAEQTGLDFINQVEDREDFNVFTYRNYYNGGGVAIGDINGDDLPDIYFTANMGPNKLYLNKGNWTFEDITDQAGVGGTRAWSTGVAMADVNADGRLDIYVCNSGDVAGDNKENELFINQGVEQGMPVFAEQANDYGLNDAGFSTHASFFDYDLDGDLDCYILNNSFKDPRRLRLDQTKRDQIDPMGGDKLFRNDDGKFSNVTAEAGIYGSADGFGLGVSVSDLNNDLLPDIYISNDFWERDYLYINQGDGTFTEELTKRLGLSPASSMGADIADLNQDGHPEIFTTDMLPGDEHRLKTMTMFDPFLFDQLNFRETYYYQMLQNCLQVNEGNGHFQEQAYLSGVAATDWSWGALIFDFDNDSRQDILVCNGIYHNITDMDFVDFVSDQENIRKLVEEKGKFDARDLLPNLASTPLANYAFQNQGKLKFRNRAFELGLGTESFSNGAAYGDLDNDGDLDLVVNNLNMPCFVYQNQSVEKGNNHFLKIKLEGQGKNPQGIGAKVVARTGDQEQTAQHFLSRGFESSVAPGLLLGLGQARQIDELTVIWPGGQSQQLTNVPADQTLVLKQEAATETIAAPKQPESLFSEVTTEVLQGNIRHRENNFNDFDHEPLLWRMRSTESPRLVKGDANGDGRTDFVLLGAADDPDKLFIQKADGRFLEKQSSGLQQGSELESTCGIFSDLDGDGDQDLLIASGGNEFEKGRENFILRFYENNGDGQFLRLDYKSPPAIGNFSCIEPADFDNDGDIDLFIGARVVPGNYGLVPRSFLLRNEGNNIWNDITTQAIGTLGMITDAAWTDTDGDGDKDLVVIGDWMPITILANVDGQVDVSQIIPDSEGWWNRLEVADMNGDGQEDLLLGNWGLNSKFSASPEAPLELWVKDFDQNGKSEFILNWRPPLETQNYPFAGKKDLTSQLPHLLKKVLTYNEYAGQTYATLFTEAERAGAAAFQVKKLESGIYWNEGGTFSWKVLPREAQVSPVMAISGEDLDGDGVRDIWLGGNLFAVQPKVGHLSANHGVFLKGDGKGDFSYLSPRQSGIYVKGEVRDVQWIPGANGSYTMLVSRNDAGMMAFRK